MIELTKKERDLIARQERLQRELEQTKKAIAQKEKQRQKRDRELERAQDTRRRILVGAYMMSIKTRDELADELQHYLKREDDRRLFGLEPLESQKERGGNASAALAVGQERAENTGFNGACLGGSGSVL